MKLSELKEIMNLLSDDTEVIVKNPSSIKKESGGLVTEKWGNHDGRYNVRCTLCGYVSPDIFPGRGEKAPIYCPQCGK